MLTPLSIRALDQPIEPPDPPDEIDTYWDIGWDDDDPWDREQRDADYATEVAMYEDRSAVS